MAAVAPGQERIPSPGPPQQELTKADSSAVLDRARDAQRRFERLRVRHLPLSLDSGSSPCDELIGRMCYWHGDNHSEPDPEAVEITAAREELLDTLAHAARQLPGDGWIAGQRVHYLVEAGRAHDALAVARACTAPEPGWCEALRGLALHRLERFEDAERAYRIALKAMDPREAEEWLSLALLLERTDESRLDELAADAREAASRRLWALADPYYLVRGNDRWTEHMSRHVGGRIQRRARNPHGLPWTSGLDELAIRYGHETSWSRYVPTSGSSMRPRVTGRHPPHSERYMPPDGVLNGRFSLPAGTVSMGIENVRVLGIEDVRVRALLRGGSGATGAGQRAGSEVVMRGSLSRQAIRRPLGSRGGGSPWRVRRGGASGSCCPGC